MSKIVLNDITSTDQVSVINDNFDKLENELNNKVLYRNNPTGENNALITNIDANGKRIYNLPKPIAYSEPLRLQDLIDFNAGTGGGTTTPSALDIPFMPFGTIEATNVQAAIEEVYAEASGSGGGGGSLPAIGGITVANFSLNQSTPNNRVEIANTNPNGWNTGAGRCTLDFVFTSNNYFAANPTGHMAFGTRMDMDTIATSVRGQGALLGGVIGATNAPDYAPTSLAESWDNSFMPFGSYLFKDTPSGRNKLPEDGVPYRMILESTKTSDNSRYLRYRLYRYEASTEAWKLNVDTGDVLDHNRWADLTKTGVVFAHVFNSDLVPWSVDFSNVRITWGPAYEASADLSAKLSKYGADLEGDLLFLGDARRIRVKNDVSSGVDNITAFQAREPNSDSNVFVIPSGTATNANFYATNRSAGLANHNAISIGMENTTGVIGTINHGSTSPSPIVVRISGNTIATITPTNLNLNKTLTFVTTNSKIQIYNDGVTPSEWTALQGGTTNKATLVHVLPNGTATEATMVFSNASNIAGAHKAVTIGVQTNTAIINASGRNGATNPDLKVNIGATTVATFTPNGILLNGASQYLGTPTSFLTGQYNLGGYHAQAFAAGAIDMEIISTSGGIASIVNSTGGSTAQMVETATRPLAAMMSCLLADLKMRKVI